MRRGTRFRMRGPTTTPLLPNPLRMFSYARGGGVSRVAKGADCKSAGLCLRRFESYLPHHVEKQQHSLNLPPQLGPFSCCICRKPVPSIINSLHGVSGVGGVGGCTRHECDMPNRTLFTTAGLAAQSTSSRPFDIRSTPKKPPSVRRPVKAKRLSLMPRSTAPSHPMTLGNMRGHEGARCR
jgi:hypothetical protein